MRALLFLLTLAAASTQAGEREDFVQALNTFRSQSRNCGGTPMPAAAPVSLNSILNSVADAHSTDIAGIGKLQHEGSDGSRVLARVRRSGYAASNQPILKVRENLAVLEMNQQFVESVAIFAGHDPAHCINLMAGDVTEVGIGVAIGKYDGYIDSQGNITRVDGRYVTVVLAKLGQPGTLKLTSSGK